MLHIHKHSFGFDGILYPSDSHKDKVVIVVSSSNGGMKMAADCAAFYSANGIPALAVAIFKLAFKTERNNKSKCTDERRKLASELLTWVNDVWI